MEGIRVIKDYKINLVNLTPLKIGNGKDELDLLIDKNTKKPIILGSSIAGAIKNYLMDLKLENDVKEFLGENSKQLHNEKKDLANNKKISTESKIYISDTYGNQLKISSRAGIKRDYKYGTSEDKKKYDVDYIDSDIEFEMNFKLFAKDTSELKKEDQLMKNIIEGFKSGNLRLGANKMFGFGKFEVKKIEIREFDLEDRDDLISYILDDKKYNILNLNHFDNIKRHGYIEFDFTGSIIDSMIVKQIPQNKEVDYVNMVNSKDESIIPGTTIKGLFREYNTKILKTLNLEDELFLVEDIYGTDANSEQEEHKIGKILTSDVVVKNPKYCVYNRIKVDRFTGGVVIGGKFDEERVQGDIGFRISLKKLDENNKAAVGLILLTFRDLGLSKLPIGSSSSIGAGRIKGNKLTIKENDKVVKIEFENGKLTCNDMDYVNGAIKAIKNIEKPKDNGSEGNKKDE